MYIFLGQNGEFVADKFRLTKREADAFWKTSFKARYAS